MDRMVGSSSISHQLISPGRKVGFLEHEEIRKYEAFVFHLSKKLLDQWCGLGWLDGGGQTHREMCGQAPEISGMQLAGDQLISSRNGDKTLVLCARNPLIVRRKSIYEGDKVLGSPHPHPNPMKGAIFSFTLFLRVLIDATWADYRSKSVASH